MNHLNSILFEGIVSSEPEVKVYENKGTTVVTFVLSNHRYYQQSDDNGTLEEQVSSLPVKVWGKLGDKCINAIHKGTTVRAVGRIEVFEYQSEDKAKTYFKPSIIATHIEYKNDNKIDTLN